MKAYEQAILAGNGGDTSGMLVGPDPRIKITTSGAGNVYFRYQGVSGWHFSTGDGESWAPTKGQLIPTARTATVIVRNESGAPFHRACLFRKEGQSDTNVVELVVYVKNLEDQRTEFHLGPLCVEDEWVFDLMLLRPEIASLKYTVYGHSLTAVVPVLPSPDDQDAKVFDESGRVQGIVHEYGPAVQVTNTKLLDPYLNQRKVFGGIAELLDGTLCPFVCDEGQVIDLAQIRAKLEDDPLPPLRCDVHMANYGGLPGGNMLDMRVSDVRNVIAGFLFDESNQGQALKIDNDNMGGDPAPYAPKQFVACIDFEGQTYAFACKEGESVTFPDAWFGSSKGSGQA